MLKTIKLKLENIKFSLLLLSERYNYNHWIYNNIRNFIGNNVLEVGAGIGNITDFIMFKDKLTLLDIDNNYIRYLKNKYSFRSKNSFQVIKADIQSIPKTKLTQNKFDSIICLNILEHLKNDRQAVENMVELLQPRGKLIILVPALHWLYGTMDKHFDHYRRYNKQDIRLLLKGLPTKIVKMYYLNFLGVFGWFINGRLLKQLDLPEKQTKLFDKLVPFLGLAEKIIKPPIGQSLIVIIEKK